jgi:hypothetical protein
VQHMADVLLFQFLQVRGARVAGEPTPAYGVLPRIDAGCPDSARLPILVSAAPSRRRMSMSPSTKLPT